MIKVFAIVNHKGGVAKTTSTVNLAYETAKIGYKTLVIDADPQANATKCFGIVPAKLQHHIGNLFDIDRKSSIEDIIIHTEFEKLDILPSSIDLEPVQSRPPMGAEYVLKKAVVKVWDQYDFVFIDTPPNLGVLTTAAMAAATHILIPVQCEYLSLHGVMDIMKAIKQAKEVLNENLELAGAFVTMLDDRSNYTKQTLEEVKDFFKDKTYKSTIRRTIRVTEAQANHQPVQVYATTNAVSQDYENLAQEVVA